MTRLGAIKPPIPTSAEQRDRQDRVRIESGHGSSPCASRARVAHLPSLHRPDISDRGRCDVVLLGPDAALLKQPRRAATAPSVVPQAMAQPRPPTQSEPRWQKKTSGGPGTSTPRRTWLREFHSSPRPISYRRYRRAISAMPEPWATLGGSARGSRCSKQESSRARLAGSRPNCYSRAGNRRCLGSCAPRQALPPAARSR
jgi:hypothetical protein